MKTRERGGKGAGNHGSVECKLREESCSKTSPSTDVEKSRYSSTEYVVLVRMRQLRQRPKEKEG